MQVTWSTKSLYDIFDIYNYIAIFNPYAARSLASEIYKAGNSLQTFPHRGRLVSGSDMREWPLVHPYIIRYRVNGDEVRILRVRHGARQG